MPPKPDSTDNVLASVTEQLQNIASRQDQFLTVMTALVDKVAQISILPTPNAASTSHTHLPPNFPNHNSLANYSSSKVPKLQLLPFDGSDPLDWLFQADQYFALYQTPREQRLDLMSFYMHGEALSWYKWMYHNHQLTTWDEFTRALTIRFGPSSYENHQQELFKIKQSTTVAEYQGRFERICNQVVGLSTG